METPGAAKAGPPTTDRYQSWKLGEAGAGAAHAGPAANATAATDESNNDRKDMREYPNAQNHI